ncbi:MULTISPECIES: hypothetical protein [Haloferacaceae]|uniref:Uncharacterized protein n=1 Tax=Halorubrum glutamatedens TaxID=2707018 RepID=A0ABD5QTT8_9EURY|nr:hypothetical protein [Halobellus captivus]
MSTIQTSDIDDNDDGGEPADGTQSWAERHREELEREANSDLPHAWVAEQFLESIPDQEERDDEDDEEGDS